MKMVQFGMGCFWGAERRFWQMEGVYTTAAGYSGGVTENPTYEEVCSGGTGHTETVLVVYDETVISLMTLLKMFWESHDPTQGMRQGNDLGTQYRSAIYTFDEEQAALAQAWCCFSKGLPLQATVRLRLKCGCQDRFTTQNTIISNIWPRCRMVITALMGPVWGVILLLWLAVEPN